MNDVRSTDFQFQFKQTWFGVVLMYREAVPGSFPGYWEWGHWRKAKWSDMYLYRGTTP